MRRLLTPNSNLLALILFLPITPSIAALTVFTQSVIYNRSTQVPSISHYEKRLIDS